MVELTKNLDCFHHKRKLNGEIFIPLQLRERKTTNLG